MIRIVQYDKPISKMLDLNKYRGRGRPRRIDYKDIFWGMDVYVNGEKRVLPLYHEGVLE